MKLSLRKKQHTLNDIVAGCSRKESWAQKALYDRYAGGFYAVCIRYVKDEDTAEDILIKAFMRILEKIDQYSGKGSFEGWMRRIVVNEALGFLRSTKHWQQEVDIQYADYTIQREQDHLQAEDLMAMVQALPEGYRTVFNLYAIEGYNHAEIAEQLGISENTSKSQYSRARKLLQKWIAAHEQLADSSTNYWQEYNKIVV